jgi:peptidoglycan hydrolase CwlO-like protein/surface antigen
MRYGIFKSSITNTKTMPKTSKKSLFTTVSSRLALFAVTAVLLVAGVTAGFKSVYAANATCNSIAECSAQISESKNAVANLQAEAVSYQDAVARLNGQISLLQTQIDYNTSEQTRLTAEITAKQAEIDHERKILASDLKAMYVDDEMSTIEMLATSKNLSEYVDKEEYRNAVQSKIQSTLKEIAVLQAQLQSQKSQVEALLAEQHAQQDQLAAARAEQANLLAYNESQQASYNAQTSANQSKLDALIAAQRRANNDTSAAYYFLRFPGAVGGFNGYNYPYANAGFGMSTAPGCVDNDGPDQWGYCTRQCVSYAAWAVAASGRSAPYFYGNAKDWVGAARAHGVPVYTSNPQPGDVAISTAGTWGHAMYVEAVSGSSIYVSQYNQQLTGQYSTQWRTYQ